MYGVGITHSEARSIASVLSGRLRIKIEEGESWSFNFKTQTINYVRKDIAGLTRIELIANLLHEAGHAKYSKDPAKIKFPSSIPVNHRKKLHELNNSIEDFRIEDLMRAFYPYAVDYLPEYSFKTKYQLELIQDRYIRSGKAVPKYIQYTYAIYARLAGYESIGELPEVTKIVDKTEYYAHEARRANSNQELVDIIVKDMYPHIKHWLDEYDEKSTPPPMRISPTGGKGEYKFPTYDELYSDIKSLIHPTMDKLRRVLTDNLFSKFVGKYRTGPKIIENQLYRHKTGDYRLFHRELSAKAKNYVFALLVDESGSMHGQRVINATKGAILFSQVLNQLNIPYGVYGFNGEYKKYKRPKDKFSSRLHGKYEEMMANTEEDSAGFNNDAEAVYLTAQDLKDYSSKKVIFVLSDGEPAPSFESVGKGFDNLADTVRTIERQGITVVGIGIQNPNVAEYYKTHILVDKISDLPQAILGALRRELKS